MFFPHAVNFTAHHCHPFIEDLLEVIRRNLGADGVAGFNGSFNGADEFVFVGFNLERHKICTDMGRHFV